MTMLASSPRVVMGESWLLLLLLLRLLSPHLEGSTGMMR
jgi:hypothetical protein